MDINLLFLPDVEVYVKSRGEGVYQLSTVYVESVLKASREVVGEDNAWLEIGAMGRSDDVIVKTGDFEPLKECLTKRGFHVKHV